MKYKYIVVDISADWEVWYKAIIPAFPRMLILADTPEQLNDVVKIMIEEEIEDLKKEWKSIPLPDNVDRHKYSWSFVLRIKPELHKRVSDIAQAKWCSINRYVADLIEENSC